MTGNVLADALAQLAAAHAHLDTLRLRKEQLIHEVTPAEVRRNLEEIEAEFVSMETAVRETIDHLTDFIRDTALTERTSVSGPGFSVSYQNGRVKWNDEKLLRIVSRLPRSLAEEILACRTGGKPYTTITKNGKTTGGPNHE